MLSRRKGTLQSLFYISFEIHKPNIKLKIEISPFISKEKPGYSTKTEPIVKPIITK